MDNKQANVERFNAKAAEWDDDPKRVRMGQGVAQAMLDALQPSGREQALEFGAGTGILTTLMAPRLARVTALDSSSGMLGVLRRKCADSHLANVDAVEGSVPEQLPDQRFDLVYSSMTLHHVEDVPGLLRALADHVQPGGHVALADLDVEDGGFHREAQGVVHHGFAREAVDRWLRDAGFDDVRFSTAYTMQREGARGATRDYPIFLTVARKPEH